MHLSVRVLGLELLSIEANTDEAEEPDGGGVTASTVVGFCPSPGDQAWEQGVER